MLYELRQLARKLDENRTLVAYYRDKYSEFIPTQKVRGKQHPMYEQTALEILKFAIRETRNGMDQETVKQALIDKGYQPLTTGEVVEGEDQDKIKTKTSQTFPGKPKSNLPAKPTTTMAQQAIISAEQSANFTHSLLLEIKDQNAALKLKDDRIFKLKKKLKARRQELKSKEREYKARIAELEADLQTEKDEYDKLERSKFVVFGRNRGE